MKTVLFYWSKGAETRRNMILLIAKCEREKESCYLSKLAKSLEISHVGLKKHVDLLIEEGYIKILNPEGKPHFLVLTKEGLGVLKELRGENKYGERG